MVNLVGGKFFGHEIIHTVANKGAMWYGGVKYGEYIYCAPYNTNSILCINYLNETCSLIELITNESINNKYINGCLSNNNLIYFAPHNTDSLLELNPITNTMKLYQNKSLFNSSENCCQIINNPYDGLLYLIPKVSGSSNLEVIFIDYAGNKTKYLYKVNIDKDLKTTYKLLESN